MMRSNNLIWHNHGGYTEITAPSLNVNATDEDESKRIIMHEGLSDNCSTDVSESKQNIVNKTLLQNNSMNVSEYTITELKKGYKEPSDTKEVTSYFKIIECGRNILDRHAVTYQRVFMATPQDKYYNALLDNIFKDNNRKDKQFSNDKIQQAVGKVMEETEAEFERNINECSWPPQKTNTIMSCYII